jgi:hypothetical protein
MNIKKPALARHLSRSYKAVRPGRRVLLGLALAVTWCGYWANPAFADAGKFTAAPAGGWFLEGTPNVTQQWVIQNLSGSVEEYQIFPHTFGFVVNDDEPQLVSMTPNPPQNSKDSAGNIVSLVQPGNNLTVSVTVNTVLDGVDAGTDCGTLEVWFTFNELTQGGNGIWVNNQVSPAAYFTDYDSNHVPDAVYTFVLLSLSFLFLGVTRHRVA